MRRGERGKWISSRASKHTKRTFLLVEISSQWRLLNELAHTHCMLVLPSLLTRRAIPVALALSSTLATTATAARQPSHLSLAATSQVTFQRNYAMGSNASTAANFPKGKSEEDWRAQLSPEQFRILRKKGTEMAGSGKYDAHYPKEGVYTCAGCDSPLYKANTKFKSGCGWPAFFDAIPGAIDRHVDRTFGMKRIEITCSACGGHLGHVFEGEGFPNPTDERHCVNSVSLNL